MGYCIKLTGGDFDAEGWLNDVIKHVSGFGGGTPRLSQLCTQIIDDEDQGDTPEFWFHQPGGIRGVTLRCDLKNKTAELSLPTGVSETDFQNAGEYARMALLHGATATDDEGNPTDCSEETIRRISAETRAFNWASLASMAGDGECTLPVGGILHLKIFPADAARGAEALEGDLVDRMNRYSSAYLVMGGVARHPHDNSEISFGNYAHSLASLIHADTQLITTQDDGGQVIPTPIPAEHFYNVIGDLAEDLGPYRFVPAIDLPSRPELVSALAAVPASGTATTTPRQPTGEDWALLAKAAILVGYWMAAIDGSVGKKEIQAVAQIVMNPSTASSPVFSKILGIAKANLETLIGDAQREQLELLPFLMQIMALLKSGAFPPAESEQIARGLYGIAHAVASAAGGFLGFGSKISKDEKALLDVIETLLLK